MSTVVSLTLPTVSNPSGNEFAIAAREKSYTKWEFVPEGASLMETQTVSLNRVRAANYAPETVTNDTLSTRAPGVDAEGLPYAKLAGLTTKVTRPNWTSDTAWADIVETHLSALKDSLIHGQIVDNDIIF